MFNLRDFLAHSMANGSWDYECTGKPLREHYIFADRVIVKAKQRVLSVDFNKEITDA